MSQYSVIGRSIAKPDAYKKAIWADQYRVQLRPRDALKGSAPKSVRGQPPGTPSFAPT